MLQVRDAHHVWVIRKGKGGGAFLRAWRQLLVMCHHSTDTPKTLCLAGELRDI